MGGRLRERIFFISGGGVEGRIGLNSRFVGVLILKSFDIMLSKGQLRKVISMVGGSRSSINYRFI